MSKGASKLDGGERNITEAFPEKVTSEPRRREDEMLGVDLCVNDPQYFRMWSYLVTGLLEIQFIKMRSYWSRLCPSSNMTRVLLRRGKRHRVEMPCGDRGTQTQREGTHVKVEAEVGVLLPQTKISWGHQKLADAPKVA